MTEAKVWNGNVSIPDVGGTQSVLAMDEKYLLARYSNTQSYPQSFCDMAYDLSQIKPDASGNYPSTLNNLWFKTNRPIHAFTKTYQYRQWHIHIL